MRRRLAVTATLVLASVTAEAHDTWLAPRSFHVAPGRPIVVDMTSGMVFPDLDHAPEAQRLAIARMRLGGRLLDISNKARAAHALVLTAPLAMNGLAAVFFSTRPLTLTLSDAQVEEYLDEIGAKDSVGRIWRERPAPKTWRETYRKHGKTFVRVGDAADESWREPVGRPLEIVPESTPMALRAGAEITLRVLSAGQPAADFRVSGFTKGAARRLVRTDRDGRAALKLDRPGPWLLAGTELRPSGDAWASDFTTLTLEVQP